VNDKETLRVADEELLLDIRSELRASADVLARTLADDALVECISDIAILCSARLRAGNKLLFAGNGGSAADAQHFAGELVGRFKYDRPGLAAIALTTDTSILTAIGNDYGYEHLFARQVEALGRAGDVLIAISTSGRSANVLAALKVARQLGIYTVGFTGSATTMRSHCDKLICVPSQDTAKVQEMHTIVGHAICRIIEASCHPR
jgi:D-sedoheptulose 7-phosphate isomerase